MILTEELKNHRWQEEIKYNYRGNKPREIKHLFLFQPLSYGAGLFEYNGDYT